MAYNAQIPQANDQISVSQGQILANFQFLNTIASGIFDAPAQLTVPVIAAGDVALYAKVPAAPFPLTGTNELFLVKSSGAAFPLTAQGITGGVSWCYLPSGLIMKWGQFTATGTQQFVYPVAANVPAFTLTPTSIQLTPVRNGATQNAQIYLDSFTAGANTNLQLGVYVTQLNNPSANGSISFRFLSMGF